MISTFDFLSEFEELHSKAVCFDKYIEKDFKLSVVNGKNFLEEIIKFVIKQNDLEEYLEYGYDDQLKILEDKGVLKKEFCILVDKFNIIINYIQEKDEIKLNDIKKLHSILFMLSIYIKQEYSLENFDSKKYNEQLLDVFYKQLNEEYDTNDTQTEGINKIYGSYLLYQLEKLNDSSREVIQNSTQLGKFKNYLHVKRPIQLDLENKIIELADSHKSQLILLCGSVGDGKSHLLAYMNENYHENMAKYIIHNDATESFDPHKSSIETLIDLLNPFSDKNINISSEKIIVAINLGVLNNFLENQFVKKNYTKLSKFIKDSNIFDKDILSSNMSRGNLHLISFSDYQMFELNKEGVKSKYFSEIFKKIVDKSEDNPFYNAYIKDIKSKCNNIVMYNYRLFQQKGVRDFIVDILIKAIVQYKSIFSTRAIFNFIYDILVPSNIEEKGNLKSVIDITENLLPNLLFESQEKSSLLKIINKFDPINIRTSKIDSMLMELNNCNNIKKFFKKTFDIKYMSDWVDSLENLGPFYGLSEKTKANLMKTFIRFAKIVLLSQSKQEDLVYKDYIKYLYNFNIGNFRELKDLFSQIKEAIFTWKGTPNSNKNILYLCESLGDMKIAQNLKITPNIDNFKMNTEYEEGRFKNSITIGFNENNSKQVVTIEIDYPLYVIIRNVLKGQRPSKKDKEQAIKFIEFIDKLIRLSNDGEEILVHDLKNNLIFKLEYDSTFGGFIFRKE